MLEVAYFAAGCFWGTEAAFRSARGVVDVVSGYAGGHASNPSYEEVSAGLTGHAETVMVEFDPKITPYEKLLDVFWQVHDPTQLNRQGPDVGPQYRSAIFYATPAQAQAALVSKAREQAMRELPLTTEIAPIAVFWRAEDQHQRYHERQGGVCGA